MALCPLIISSAIEWPGHHFVLTVFCRLINGSVFKPWLEHWPIEFRTAFRDLNTRVVWYSDVHCITLLETISDTFTWTWNEECYSSLALAWMTLCQLYTRMEIEYLPVYYPNKLEQADIKLFSGNVQKIMARHLNLPTSNTSVNHILSKIYKWPISISDTTVSIRKPQTSKYQYFHSSNFKWSSVVRNPARV
jgi:hypothetical protein